jgi:hypothetical protein
VRLNLDFVAISFDFVAPGFDFVAADLAFVAVGFVLVAATPAFHVKQGAGRPAYPFGNSRPIAR